jgi:predicted nucleic acid-binding protein
MKLLDANPLLYAVNEDAPLHDKARAWIEEILSSGETVAFSSIVMLAFLRISTRPGVFPKPLLPETAFTLVERAGSYRGSPRSKHLAH